MMGGELPQITLLGMDGGNNLKNILTAVNPDELFKLLFIDDERAVCRRCPVAVGAVVLAVVAAEYRGFTA